jgi:hypothetical protein
MTLGIDRGLKITRECAQAPGAGSAEVRALCVPLWLLLFRVNTCVDAHCVKSRGGGLKCAHLRAPHWQANNF